MEEPQLLRVVLPGGQDQVVTSQTQGPFDGGIERPVQHHIVHPWGLNQLRKLHGLPRPQPRDCRVREGRGGHTAAGLGWRMTRLRAGRRGGDGAGRPRPAPGSGGRGEACGHRHWPRENKGWGWGWARPGRLSRTPGPSRPGSRVERTLRGRPSSSHHHLGTRPRLDGLKGERGGRFRTSFQHPAARNSWRK